MEYLFSYGTLQEDDVQVELFGRRLNGGRDVLKGYKTSPIELTEEGFASYTEQATYLIASVSDDENDAIEGTALEVSGEDLSVVDGYEPEEYKRAKVTLELGKRAWIYLKAE